MSPPLGGGARRGGVGAETTALLPAARLLPERVVGDHEGGHRLYAELVRLRDLVRIAEGPVPLLFLLDEILHGTNSHDRRLGAAAVVRGLLERGAIGLVTTHDLALSEVADDPTLRAVNVHFEDRLEDGKMVFDYRMRSGVVRTSNALALMRALGLLR